MLQLWDTVGVRKSGRLTHNTKGPYLSPHEGPLSGASYGARYGATTVLQMKVWNSENVFEQCQCQEEGNCDSSALFR